MKTTPVCNFQGATVLCFESRMSSVIHDHITRLNGHSITAPSVQEIPLDKNPDADAFGKNLLNQQYQMIIFTTGVGAKYLLEGLIMRYGNQTVVEALNRTTIVARGPKSVKVLRELGIAVTLTVPEPNTWKEIIETLEMSSRTMPLDRLSIAVQEYGQENTQFIHALKKTGARVTQVPVYRWALPDDPTQLCEGIRLVAEGKVDFAFFTSAIQIRHALKMASQMGIENEFRLGLKKTVVVSIGPTTSEALQAEGVIADFEPTHPKMGHLVAETAEHAERLLKEKKKDALELHYVKKTPEPLTGRLERRQSPFMKACFQEEVPFTPIWIMRQAGRYMKEYNDVRRKVSFLQLCKNPELAAEVTLQAVDKLKVDAAIIFSDILLILEPMGLGLEFLPAGGPQILGAIESAEDVARLRPADPREKLSFVYDAIKLTRTNLNPAIPLIGFSGAPFTLAAYAIEGGSSKSFLKTKAFMYEQPKAWHRLMEQIAGMVEVYLKSQIEAGADALQLFDSWVGCLSAHDYSEYVAPYSRRIFDSLPSEIPAIHFGVNTSHLLKAMSAVGGRVLGLDFRTSIQDSRALIGSRFAIQGNLDPVILLAEPEIIEKEVRRILSEVGNMPGHIFNLGHGILPQTPVENAVLLVDLVHRLSRRPHA